jgi:hypothetical protein
MHHRQAAAAEVGGDLSMAFSILARLSLDAVLAGESAPLRSAGCKLGELGAALGQAHQDKLLVLAAAADWYEHGGQLSDVVPALGRLASAADPDTPVLTCLVIEQAIADGLFDQVPPGSATALAGAVDPGLLRDLAALAAAADTPDVVIRARLRCAAADAALPLSADADAVEQAYGDLAHDALAGRYLHARGLITSRAAYAFAVRGATERAITLWRQSILSSSEDGYYGDARNAIRAIRRLCWDHGILSPAGLEVADTALPNRRQLLAGAHDPALTTLDAAHRGKLPDAFADARRYLLESRTAGHVYEEILAQTLLGDVLAAAGQPAPAVCVYVMVGQAGKAATLAAGLPGIIDVTGWLASGLRRRRAAAIQVIGAQSALFDDDAVPHVVGSLLSAAHDVWEAPPLLQPHPERDALQAIASFGIRIPEAAVDGILDATAPALSQATGVSDTVASLLIQSYWAVETRRADLAAALTRMLRLPNPPYNLWGFVTSLPSAARGPILPTVRDLGENGNQEAITALASWGEAPAAVQLAARRACAAFLRRPVGVTQATISVGTEEEAVVHLVIALLQAGDLCGVPVGELAPDKARPAGGVILTSVFGPPGGDGAQTTQPAGGADAPTPAHDDGRASGKAAGFPDTAAIQAAGAPAALAVAVARHLTAIGGDTCAGAGPRASALSALRRLLPKLPAPVFRALAGDPSPTVRTVVASRAPELPDDVGHRLVGDAHAHVRHATRTA